MFTAALDGARNPLVAATLAGGALLLAACNEPAPSADEGADGLRGQVMEWREERLAKLTGPYDWLSLVGLEWLEPGRNTVGSGDGNDVVLPGGPERWGVIVVDGEVVRFEAEPDAGVTVDGEPRASARLVVDDQGEPSVVGAGTLRFHVMDRGELALRVKDSQAPTRVRFNGLQYFPVDPEWAKQARFVRHPEGSTVEIANVLGQVEPRPNPGTLVFEHEGKEYSLETVDSDDDLWVIFADKTNGRSTYGAGRFVYVDKPEPGSDMTVINFHKAYNPPCVFTKYSTCPLPPPSNRLPIAVEAGEKDYENPPGLEGHHVKRY